MHERVPAGVEEVLGHRAARVRRHELDRRGLVGRGGDDDRVVERARVVERLREADHGRHALPDRDVDGDDVLVLVVDDRVDRDRRLAGLAVADDQLALAAADRDHAVDRLQAGLQRLLHRLALDDAGGLELGRARLARSRCRPCRRAGCRAGRRCGRAGPRRRGSRAGAGALDGVALDDVLPGAEQHGADVVGLEVEREAGDVMGQLEHLERLAVLEAVDAGDAVGHREDGADLGEVGLALVEPLDAALEDGGDLVWLDLHLCPCDLFAKLVQTRADRRVDDGVADADDDARRGCPGSTLRGELDLLARLLADAVADLLDGALVELDRRGDLDGEQLVLALPQPSSSRRTRKMAGMRCFSISSSRKFVRIGSAPETTFSSPSFFSGVEK